VTQSQNWGLLHSGIVIWLDVERDQLLKRLRADETPRPLLRRTDPEAAMDALLEERRPLYAEADLTVVIDDESPEVVADGILQLLPGLLRDPTQRRSD
jgi:shikimate kinase